MNIYSTMYHPHKPEGMASRNAYIVGGGLAGLAAAAFLVDDAGMPGENITILEKHNDVGGSMDGMRNEFGYLCRGEREMEPYMECLWYLYSKIPSLENEGRTVLDDIVDFNREEPIHSEYRVIVNQGEIYNRVHDYRFSPKDMADMQRFLSLPESALEDKTISDFFDESFFMSSCWINFHSCLAFKTYHSALECQRYFQRFALEVRHEYLEGIIHTKYCEYDSMIHPLMKWLTDKGVKTSYGCWVHDLEMDDACNTAKSIHLKQGGKDSVISMDQKDLILVTNGSMTTNSAFGDNKTVAPLNRDTKDLGAFTLWQNLAKKHEKFGHPEKFIGHIDKTKWVSFMPTIKGYPELVSRIEKMSGSKAGTGGAVTILDSNWDMSFELHHNPFFLDQKEDEQVMWGYGCYGENIGNYIKKPMHECTGDEIMTELLYHLNMLDIKDEVLAHSYISTCMMPYITSQFMPRKETDRPKNVPDGCTNIGFLGQYVEIPEDVVFTVEMSVRTALEAIYKLTGIEKDILEVYPSKYDIRYTVERLKKFAGKTTEEELTEDDIPAIKSLNEKQMKHMAVSMLNSYPPYYKMYLGRDKTVALKKSVLHPEAKTSK
ncbi:oleate hydratase [Clostridium sp. E02]|uniref:oleate hydratase n=1 Tax=Clostridium sp. E02 TaxID=2487134 RepID=UPI000F5208CF|nr:oleate hydratase [Clostridium sp. E02]